MIVPEPLVPQRTVTQVATAHTVSVLQGALSSGIPQLFFFFFAAPPGLQDLSSLTKDRTQAPAVKAWSPNHWTTREFPGTPNFLRNLQAILTKLCPEGGVIFIISHSTKICPRPQKETLSLSYKAVT